jgi:hypothetical protein
VDPVVPMPPKRHFMARRFAPFFYLRINVRFDIAIDPETSGTNSHCSNLISSEGIS